MSAAAAITRREALRGRLFALYDALHEHFGYEPHWWPLRSDTPHFEIMVGAVLVQQTRWETVEAAVVRLIEAGLLGPAALAAADPATLAALIRPCAFYAQKAHDLQAICRYLLAHYDGELVPLLAQPRAAARAELLSLPRIGQETADTILLYAGGHALFVVDAYARRLFARLDLAPGFDFTRARYDDVQRLVEEALTPWRRAGTPSGGPALPDPRSLAPDGSLRHFLWDLHALIVEACIHHCLASNPRCSRPGTRRGFIDERKCAGHCTACGGCPLRATCASYQRQVLAP